jgi:hypothetical protein
MQLAEHSTVLPTGKEEASTWDLFTALRKGVSVGWRLNEKAFLCLLHKEHKW